MIVDPGELDQRISFLTDTEQSDGMGGVTLTPSTVATVWAKVKTGSGTEKTGYDRVNAVFTCTFITHYRSDITEKMRISWGGNEYNIRSMPKAGGRALYSEFIAERGVAQ